MATPSQRWLRRLHEFLPPLPPHYTGVYVLVSPCTKKFCTGKSNDCRRRLQEHLTASSRITTRSMAPVHRLVRGVGASSLNFDMPPLVYACPDDDLDEMGSHARSPPPADTECDAHRWLPSQTPAPSGTPPTQAAPLASTPAGHVHRRRQAVTRYRPAAPLPSARSRAPRHSLTRPLAPGQPAGTLS